MIEELKDYKNDASFFVKTAFNMLSVWQAIDKNPILNNTYISVPLKDFYELHINTKGQLYLVKYDDSNPKGFDIIGHAFSKKHTQVTYVGKLLAVYLENLQIDNS